MSQSSVATDDVDKEGLSADVVSSMQSLLSQTQQVFGSSLLMCWEGVVHRDAMRKQYRMEAVMLMMMYDVATIIITMKVAADNAVAAVVTAVSAVVGCCCCCC